jgi:hypothetical protein
MRITDLVSGKDYFYIMHLSWGNNYRRKELWDFARQKKIIGLDHRDVLGDWPTVKDTVKNLSGHWINQFDMLCENMGPRSIDNGDIVVLMAGWDHILGIGMVIGPHRYDITYRDREEFFDHVRPVEWVLEYDYEKRKKIPRVVFDKTLSRIEKGDERWQLLSNLDFSEEMSNAIALKTKQNDADKLKELANIQTELTKGTSQVNRYKRSRELVEGLKQLYEYQCQLCSTKFTSIPQIPMRNGNNYVEVHHIKGFNEVSHIEGVNQEEADYVIDNYKNGITVCVYHHKLLHKHKDQFLYDASQKSFISRDRSSKIPLVLNKHL